MTKSTDEQLVTQLVRGQAKAFEEIYVRYDKKIMGYVFSRVKNLEASEEVFQVIWEKVYKSIYKFNSSLSFSSWIFTVSSNAVNDYFRKSSKKALPLELLEHDANLRSKQNLLEGFDLEGLSSPYKEVFRYKYVEGLTSKEISIKMSLSDSNIRKILSRGRNIIREQLGRNKL